MRKIYQILFLLTLILLIYLPLGLQVSSNIFPVSRILIGIPLIFIVICSSLVLLLRPFNYYQNLIFYILVAIFLVQFVRGMQYSGTNFTGILAYTRSLWIFVLFYLFGYGCKHVNVLPKVKFIFLIYFFISFSLLIFEYIGGADSAILLGYHNFKLQSPLRFELSHTKAFFNLKKFSEFLVYRPEGPTGSTISYAYSLLVLPFLFKIFTKYFYYSLMFLFLILLILGSKGALILFLILFLIFSYFKHFNNIKFIFVFCSIVALSISATQMISNDNHGLGLIGGIFNLIEYPFGRGIGVGGNLSGPFFNSEDGGRSFQYGSESIFGVFFTQIGLGLLLHLLFIFSLFRGHNYNAYNRSLTSICFLILMFGLSQEESWSTLAALPFLFLGAEAKRIKEVEYKGSYVN